MNERRSHAASSVLGAGGLMPAGAPLLITLLALVLVGCGGRRSEREREATVMSTRPAVAQTEVRAEPPPAEAAIGAPFEEPGIELASEEEDASTVAEADMPADQPSLPVAPIPSAAEDPLGGDVPDENGFTEAAYLALLTPEEIGVLRLRARGETTEPLTHYLTSREKENLRRRAVESVEIGAEGDSASEPARIGE